MGILAWALGFDNGAGGMCESMHVAVVIVSRLLAPVHILAIWGLVFPPVGVVLDVPGLVSITVVCRNAFVMSYIVW